MNHIQLLSERDLHYKVIDCIRKHFPEFQLIAGLGELQDSTIKRTDAYKKGYIGGQPDILILNQTCHFNGFAIELKCPSGNWKLNDKQEQYLDQLACIGYNTLVSDDYDEILIELTRYYKDIYTCKKCLKRKENDYYLRNNLHPVWFEVNKDGSYKLDEAGKKIPHFEIPLELKRLTVAERLLIRRCATFVPSVRLSNGTFALMGHCVAFPQDIAKMCDELPHRKEEILVFVRYIGNKDTSAVYPKSMRVNRRNVIDALHWLKKHNPHYSNVTINESNLDWMKGNDEANLGQEGTILSTKTSQCYKVMTTQEETVSYAHRRLDFSDSAGNLCDVEIGSMHPNKSNPLPNEQNTNIIQSLIEIATDTNQESKVMDFPSIDHDNPVK